MRYKLVTVLAMAALAACAPERSADMSNVVTAVTQRDEDALHAALASGGSANDKDYRGQPVLLIATSSNQFRIANVLVSAGADVWVADRLGFTAGAFAANGNAAPGTPEGEARDLFIAHLREAGYPWPPPSPQQVAKLREDGHWPPLAARGR